MKHTRSLTQPLGVLRTHPTMCRVMAVDCVKRLFDGLEEDKGGGGERGGHVRYRKYTPWTLPRTRKDIFWIGEVSAVVEKPGRGGLVDTLLAIFISLMGLGLCEISG